MNNKAFIAHLLIATALILLSLVLMVSICLFIDGWTVEEQSLEPTSCNVTDNVTSIEPFGIRAEVKEYVKSTGLTKIWARHVFGLLEPGDEGYGWDCDDYALALTNQAMKDGKHIGIVLVIDTANESWQKQIHMTNYYFVDDNSIEQVSARTGEISKQWWGFNMVVDNK